MPWVVFLAAAVGALCWLGAAAWPGEVDAGNLGLAILSFDPLAHRPQPPGYLLHVLVGKALALGTGSPHRALVLQSAVTAALAFVAVFALARRFLSARLSLFVALSALTSPVALYMGGEALTGIDALLFAPWVLLLLVRAREGNGRALLAGSALLGLAGGFRPDVTLFLFLPWVLALRPWGWRRRGEAAALLAAGMALWLVPTAVVCGGIGPFRDACAYVNAILAQQAPLFGGSLERGAATLWRLGWAVLLAAGPAAALGLLLLPFRRAAVAAVLPDWSRPLLYAAALPPLLVIAATFLHKKAYVFPALPALMVLGVAVLVGSVRASRAGALWLAASAASGLIAWAALPASDVLYAEQDGFGRQHDSLPRARRLLWQPLEHTAASRRSMDARVAGLAALVAAEAADGRRVAVVTHPPDLLNLRQLCLALPDVPVVELVGRPGAWSQVRVGRGLDAHHVAPGPDGSVPVDAETVIACVGFDRDWARALEAGGARLVHLRPTVVFAVVAGPVRW